MNIFLFAHQHSEGILPLLILGAIGGGIAIVASKKKKNTDLVKADPPKKEIAETAKPKAKPKNRNPKKAKEETIIEETITRKRKITHKKPKD